MRNLLLILFLCCSFQTKAQINLVPNSSFEIITSCDSLVGGFDYSISPPWNSPNTASPDLFNPCSTSSVLSVPSNGFGYQTPHSGNGYAGAEFFQSGGSTYREYIQVKLDSQLVAQHKYCATFFVSLSNIFGYASNNAGIYFSNSQTSVTGQNRLNLIPQILDTNIVSDTTNWVLISGEYIANGGEQYIIIGNFNTAATTNTLVVTDTTLSYYYIDDVSIVDCTGSGLGMQELDNPYKIKLYPNPNNGSMNLLYSMDKSSKGEFLLFDIAGSLIKKYPLMVGENNQLTISETQLNNGVYLYKVMIDGGLKYSNKIIIIR